MGPQVHLCSVGAKVRVKTHQSIRIKGNKHNVYDERSTVDIQSYFLESTTPLEDLGEKN